MVVFYKYNLAFVLENSVHFSNMQKGLFCLDFAMLGFKGSIESPCIVLKFDVFVKGPFSLSVIFCNSGPSSGPYC